ncbi:MAG TPA: TPM domain-containing protein [Oscillospiraceae bacterium]|nr:TPM domain-containing protein [Oscillospiraceae bacterium]
MKKRIFLLVVILLISAIVPITSFASNENTSSGRSFSRLVDNADLLTNEEESKLLIKLDEISERQKLDIVIVTINSLEDKSATVYADDFFDNYGYGMGNNSDGILFLLSMEKRDWAISTCGYGIAVFTDSGQKFIIDSIKKDLGKDNYNKAFNSYAELCDDFITKAKTDEPYDSGNLPKKSLSPVWILFSLIGGVIIALISTGTMKGKLKTVSMQAAADSYVVQNSMNITNNQDLFLYNIVDKKAKPKEKESSGSSTHTSSSGQEHGGSSGKF